MAKANVKGRSDFLPYIKLHSGVTGSLAWRALTCEARSLLLEVWRRHNGFNNGRIPYSHREAREALRVGARKIPKAFDLLQETGFLVNRSPASFDWKTGAGKGRAVEWEITAEPCDGHPAKALYRKWVPAKLTASTAETNCTHSGSHTFENTLEPLPNRNQSGSRFGSFWDSNGNHSGCTYNIPGGGRILRRVFVRHERRKQPSDTDELTR